MIAILGIYYILPLFYYDGQLNADVVRKHMKYPFDLKLAELENVTILNAPFDWIYKHINSKIGVQ